jgi:hypothetical protein
MAIIEKTVVNEAPQNEALPDLRQFTLELFELFDCKIKRLDKRKNGAIQVSLTDVMAEHFGKSELKLTFQHLDQSGDFDLVAHGSRMFDRMLALLDRRSALALQQLPSRHSGSEELLSAVRPVNTSIVGLRMQEQIQRLFVFNWRITYRADDKREELFSVAMDEQGSRVELSTAANAAPGSVDLEVLFEDGADVAHELDANGQPVSAKLPPMTQLIRLAEIARKYAIYHADLRCVSHEAEILPRLYQTLNRLTTYYSQQIQEVYESHDPTGEKRQALELDLDRKISEEVENHRLRVQVNLFSYAVLQMPVAVADITLSNGREEFKLQVVRNRYTGALQRPPCHACGQETAEVAIDRNGHVTCDSCICQCGSCHSILCAECGVEPCTYCGQSNCDACGQLCWACGGRACMAHSNACPVCQDTVCYSCQAECSCCGVRQCRSHLRVDAVVGASGMADLVCGACAVRCPGCQQYSAALDTCSASGQRFCRNCLVVCSSCGQWLGPGFYEVHAGSGKLYCYNCVQECSGCGRMSPGLNGCQSCGAGCCAECGGECALCQHSFCQAHIHRYGCGHALCREHMAVCATGGEAVCALCNAPCAICERSFCQDHASVCKRCGCIYCRACVSRQGLCATCSALEEGGVPVRLGDEPCVADPRVEALAPSYQWQRVTNHRYVIYLGKNSSAAMAVVVMEKMPEGNRVVAARKLGRHDQLFRNY